MHRALRAKSICLGFWLLGLPSHGQCNRKLLTDGHHPRWRCRCAEPRPHRRARWALLRIVERLLARGRVLVVGVEETAEMRRASPRPRPTASGNASTCATLMIGCGSRASWLSSHKARQRATARSRLSGGFSTLPACSTKSSIWSSVYTWSIAARTTRSRSVDWQSCNPHPR